MSEIKVVSYPKNKGIAAVVVNDEGSIGIYGTGGFILGYFHGPRERLVHYNEIVRVMEECSDRLHDFNNIKRYLDRRGVEVFSAPVLYDSHIQGYTYNSCDSIDKLAPKYWLDNRTEKDLIDRLIADSKKLGKLPKYIAEFDLGVANENP